MVPYSSSYRVRRLSLVVAGSCERMIFSHWCIIRSFPGIAAPANESTKATSCGRCAAIRKAMVPPMLCPASPVLPRRMSFRRRR